MRRRRKLHGGVPVELTTGRAPRWEDDLSLSFAVRNRLYREWEAEWEAWRNAREAWAEARGWPGGDDVREMEELSTRPGSAPFDPSVV